jgi:UDP-N-acetylmuramoyl-tripeptide--D-alanyl-D-alanine ligase
MRLEWVDAGQVTIINDAYNANPSSVVAAAEVLGDQPGRRRVMVVGDMRELGQAAEQLHLQAGRDIVSRNLDLLIGVGALGRYIAVGAGRSALATECFDTVDELADQIGDVLAPGDVVLVKGSRAMGMERLVLAIEVVFQK